jgi:hypothetical protein
MCLEDIKIMGKSGAAMKIAAITNSSGMIVGPSPDRIGLIFCPHDTDSYWITTEPIAVVGQGIRIAVDGLPFELNVFRHGDFCRRRWTAITEAGAATVAVGELFLSEALTREVGYGSKQPYFRS